MGKVSDIYIQLQNGCHWQNILFLSCGIQRKIYTIFENVFIIFIFKRSQVHRFLNVVGNRLITTYANLSNLVVPDESKVIPETLCALN